MVELDLAGWNLAGAAAVDDLDVLAAGQALRDPAGIHRDIAAADHHHRLRHLGALARVHPAQEPHSVDDPLVLLSPGSPRARKSVYPSAWVSAAICQRTPSRKRWMLCDSASGS